MHRECPSCAADLSLVVGDRCPACGAPVQLSGPLLADDVQPLSAPSASDRHRQLVRFHTTLLAMTPRTWAITAIVVANVLVFIAMLLAGGHPMKPAIDLVLDWGANYGPLTLHGQPWRLFTCMFLHFGLIHIGFNMYVLWQIGHLVERLVGNIGLLVLYCVTGVGASVASLAWNPTVVSAGASGAVFGVCGALLGFILLRRDTIPREVILGLRSSLVTFLIYNILFGMLVPAIDMAAHLGGFLCGVLCGAALSQPVAVSSVTRRWRRNVLLLFGGALVLTAAFRALPVPASDTRLVERQIQQLDSQAIDRLEALKDQLQENGLTGEQFAQAVERDVIPLWQKAQTLCGELDTPDGKAAREHRKKIQDYLAMRLARMKELVSQLRQNAELQSDPL